MQRISKSNENRKIFNEEFGPFALCNRKQVTKDEQFEAQLKAYNELIHYVGKVSTILFCEIQIFIIKEGTKVW